MPELTQADFESLAGKLDGLDLNEAEAAILDRVLDRAADEEVSGFLNPSRTYKYSGGDVTAEYSGGDVTAEKLMLGFGGITLNTGVVEFPRPDGG